MSAELTRHFERVVGVDYDKKRVEQAKGTGREVEHEDPTDGDFWERIEGLSELSAVLLAVPEVEANRFAIELLRKTSFSGQTFAIAHYVDEVAPLRQLGVVGVYVYQEAGLGWGVHVRETLEKDEIPSTTLAS